MEFCWVGNDTPQVGPRGRRTEESVSTTANWVWKVIGVALSKVRTREERKAK